jgi:hypothetical protein
MATLRVEVFEERFELLALGLRELEGADVGAQDGEVELRERCVPEHDECDGGAVLGVVDDLLHRVVDDEAAHDGRARCLRQRLPRTVHLLKRFDVGPTAAGAVRLLLVVIVAHT